MLLLITIPLMILTFVITLFLYTQIVRLKIQKLVITDDSAGTIKGVKHSIKNKDISALAGNSILTYANSLTAGSIGKSLKLYKGFNKNILKDKISKAYLDNRIKLYRSLAVISNITTLLLVIVNTIYSVMIIFTLVSFVAIAGLVSSGLLFDTNLNQSKGTAISSSASTDNDSEGSKFNGSTDAPIGVNSEDWDSGDELGKRIAKTAYDAATMKFPSAGNPSDASADGGLRYQQGNTPIGVYDCSTFVSAVLESNGILSNGGKRSGGNYDFNTMKKSDLQNYEYTGQELISWSKLASPVARQDGSNNWYKSLKPGDLIIDSNHVAVYVGKNESGKGVIAHAASPGASYIFNDMAQSKSTYDVGLNDENTFNQLFSNAVVYRPSQMYGG